jgi:hypothetical protein
MANAGSGELIINNIPPGQWVVIAAAERIAEATLPGAFSVGTVRTPLTITHDETVTVNLRMRALQPADPPIAITLAARIPVLTRSNVLPVAAFPRAA